MLSESLNSAIVKKPVASQVNLVFVEISSFFNFSIPLAISQILHNSITTFFFSIQLGNKADLIHLRQVSTDEGEILAKDFDCKFYEISAAEQVQQVSDAFLDLCREILQAKRKSKQSFIDKIDRMFMGGTGRVVYNRGKSDSAAISKEWPINGNFLRLWSLSEMTKKRLD